MEPFKKTKAKADHYGDWSLGLFAGAMLAILGTGAWTLWTHDGLPFLVGAIVGSLLLVIAAVLDDRSVDLELQAWDEAPTVVQYLTGKEPHKAGPANEGLKKQINRLATFITDHYDYEIGAGYPDGTNRGNEGSVDVAIRLLNGGWNNREIPADADLIHRK